MVATLTLLPPNHRDGTRTKSRLRTQRIGELSILVFRTGVLPLSRRHPLTRARLGHRAAKRRWRATILSTRCEKQCGNSSSAVRPEHSLCGSLRVDTISILLFDVIPWRSADGRKRASNDLGDDASCFSTSARPRERGFGTFLVPIIEGSFHLGPSRPSCNPKAVTAGRLANTDITICRSIRGGRALAGARPRQNIRFFDNENIVKLRLRVDARSGL